LPSTYVSTIPTISNGNLTEFTTLNNINKLSVNANMKSKEIDDIQYQIEIEKNITKIKEDESVNELLKAQIRKEYELSENTRKIDEAKTENILNTSQLDLNMNDYMSSPYKSYNQLT
jgi:hypothetical protein